MAYRDFGVLVAVGEESQLSPLLTFACALAQTQQGAVTLLCVTQHGERPDWLRVPDRRTDVPVRVVVRAGDRPSKVILAAVAWALIKGILEFPGVLAVAVVGGWTIGAVLWQVRATPLLSALIAAGAWLVGLVLTWLVAMAILPGSSRTFLERVEATPFLEWQGPQFGPIEMMGLVLYVGAALYGARPRSS